MRPLIYCLAIFAAAPAFASVHAGGSGTDGAYLTFGINFNNDGGTGSLDENSTRSLVLQSEINLSGRVDLGVSFTTAKEDYQGSFYSERYNLGLHPKYNFERGQAGVYAIAGTGKGDPETQYGIEGNMSAGAFDLEGYLGVLVEDGDSVGVLGAGALAPISDRIDGYAIHRRDFFDTGYFALTTLGISYALGGADSGSSSVPPLILALEASRFHDDDEGLLDSDWNQVSFTFTYLLGGGKRSLFRGVRSVDYFYD